MICGLAPMASQAAGGDMRKGAAYSIRAAEFAADRLAYEEAALHYERAIRPSAADVTQGGLPTTKRGP